MSYKEGYRIVPRAQERGKRNMEEDVRIEAKSKQKPLQTSRQAMKAMAQQVPMRSSDILLNLSPLPLPEGFTVPVK
jgi:hypothetical protein